MKTLFLILLMSIGLIAFSQTIILESGYTITTVDNYWKIDIPAYEDMLYDAGIQIRWLGLTGVLDGTVSIQHGLEGDTLRCDYGMNQDLNTANGYSYFELWEVTATDLYVNFDRNNITGGLLRINYMLRKK